MVAKIRPALIVCRASADDVRALVTIVPHTTAVRGGAFEVPSDVKFLKEGAFDTQQIVTIPLAKLIRKLGELPEDQMANVEHSLRDWLGLG